jgi:hypothetical protein
MTLSEELAAHFASIALGHVRREYPHKLDHVLTEDADALPPRVLHPIFHGSFDWHSCVHGYWLLAHLLRRFPDMAPAGEVAALLDAMLTPDKVAGELAYLRRPASRGFERPYGWAWLLKLQAELEHHGGGHAAILRPLAAAFAAQLRAFLPALRYPQRVGTHSNTAFAIVLALDYAAIADPPLEALLRGTAERLFRGDVACQAWEPDADAFLSPALIEADCMRRVLSAEDFAPWFAAFLPHLAADEPVTLFQPAVVSDRSDGKIAHLDGLNFSRAWCWRNLAAVPAESTRLLATAEAHLQAALPHVAGDYMGEHWLASFAVLALEAGSGMI